MTLLMINNKSTHVTLHNSYLANICLKLFEKILSSAPRIGNTVFAAFVNRKIPSNYRVEVDTDIITMIPKVLGLYRHAGIPVVIDSDETGP